MSRPRTRNFSMAFFLGSIALAACAQPVDAPVATPSADAASVAELRMIAERIAADLPARGDVRLIPLLQTHPDALEPNISPSAWKRLEEAARPELPALIAEVERMALRESGPEIVSRP